MYQSVFVGMSTGNNMAENVFSFRHLSSKTFPSLSSRTGPVHDSLLKWSLDKSLQAQAFSYDQPFQPYQANEFVLVSTVSVL